MWGIKLDINQHDNHKNDHEVNPHAIRIMIYIIAKQMVRTQQMGLCKHGWSQKLYMHVKGLINMASYLNKTWVIKTKHHKYSYDHYVYACALDLDYTY